MSTSDIRKLFRSFDVNNDRTLQHAEFQKGMIMLGLKAASDPYVRILLLTVQYGWLL